MRCPPHLHQRAQQTHLLPSASLQHLQYLAAFSEDITGEGGVVSVYCHCHPLLLPSGPLLQYLSACGAADAETAGIQAKIPSIVLHIQPNNPCKMLWRGSLLEFKSLCTALSCWPTRFDQGPSRKSRFQKSFSLNKQKTGKYPSFPFPLALSLKEGLDPKRHLFLCSRDAV